MPLPLSTMDRMALELLESARHPRTTLQTPFRWAGDDAWRELYERVTPEKAEELRKAGEQRRLRQRAAKEAGRARSE